MNDNIDVIFSYSIEDSYIAMRIYEDLLRCGINVWGFERNAETSVKFHSKYINLLQNSTKVFCYCDTSNARHSNFVLAECEHALQSLTDYSSQLQRIIVNLCEPYGEWRFDFSDKPEAHKQIFRKINEFNFIRFDIDDIYDQDRLYFRSITTLCKTLGVSYRPWTKAPRLDEFRSEVNNIQNKDIDIDERESLLNGYHYIQNSIDRGRSNNSKKLELLVADCNEIFKFNPKWPAFNRSKSVRKPLSPYLALAKSYLDEARINRSHDTYAKIVNQFPFDPRGYVGLGNAAFELGNYELAATSYIGAIEKIHNLSHLRKHTERLFRVKYNLFQTYLAKNDFNKAESFFHDEFTNREFELPELIIAKFYLAFKKNDLRSASELYTNTISKYYAQRDFLETYIREILAESERMYLELLLKLDENLTSIQKIESIERAEALAPTKIRYKSELAVLYLENGRLDRFEEKAIESLQIRPYTIEDYYYLGLSHYFLNDKQNAIHYFKLSNNKIGKYYDELE